MEVRQNLTDKLAIIGSRLNVSVSSGFPFKSLIRYKGALFRNFVIHYFLVVLILPQVGFSADLQIEGYRVHNFMGTPDLKEDLTYIVFAGDFGFKETALDKRDIIDRFVESQKSLLSKFDYRIGNLEFGLHGPSDNTRIKELDVLTLQTLDALGFNAVSLANNHSLDHGPDAVHYSAKQLEEYDVSWFGTKSQPFHSLEINGIRIAIFGMADALDKPDVTNVIMKMEPSDIDFYRNHVRQYDVAIAFIHLGSGSRYQSPHEAEQVHLLQDLGFTLVICTGSHFVKGAYLRDDKPIILGTGNYFLESIAYYTEYLGSLVVIGMNESEVEQVLIIPFKNDIFKSEIGPLNKIEFENFLVNHKDWSDTTTEKYYQDDLVLSFMKQKIRSYGVNIFSDLKFRHIVYGIQVLYSNFTLLFVLLTAFFIGIIGYTSTVVVRKIRKVSPK